jgi:hypothetical protein
MEAKNSVYDKLINKERENKLSQIDPVILTAKILAVLGPEQKTMVSARYGLGGGRPKTLQEIGDKFGKTRERVRQIIASAFARIRAAKIEEYQIFVDLVHGVMRDAGGFLPEEILLSKLAHNHPSSEQLSYLKFLLDLDDLVRIEKVGRVTPSWALKSSPHELIVPVCAALEEILEKEGALISQEELLAKVKQHPVYEKNKHLLSDSFIRTAMPACTRVVAGLGKKYGLAEWRDVNPKSLRDKIYWVLTKYARPMHYREIAEAIRKEKFKRAKPFTIQAVHNELIADPRMVLIGRGIYALATWGYFKGTVADVIRRVLREAGRPLTEEEIIKGVLAQRKVKEATVSFNLRRKGAFVRLPDGRFVAAIPRPKAAARAKAAK